MTLYHFESQSNARVIQQEMLVGGTQENEGSRLTIRVRAGVRSIINHTIGTPFLPTSYSAIKFRMQESDVLAAETGVGLISNHAYYILFIILKKLMINLRSLATMHLEQQSKPVHGQCIIR